MTQAVPHIQNVPHEARFPAGARAPRVGFHTIVSAFSNRLAVMADRQVETPAPDRSAMWHENRVAQLGVAGRHIHGW